jgi:hypothetical protein
VELKPAVLAGILTALIVISVLAGIQIGNYFGTWSVPSSNQGGSLGFIPPFDAYLDGIVSWNSSTISKDQTINVNVSITNPSIQNSTVTVPYAQCISGLMLSSTNGSEIGFLTGTGVCNTHNFNETMKPGQYSMVSYIVGFSENIASYIGFENSSVYEYSLPMWQDLVSGKYELTVLIGQYPQGLVSIIIPISIFT